MRFRERGNLGPRVPGARFGSMARGAVNGTARGAVVRAARGGWAAETVRSREGGFGVVFVAGGTVVEPDLNSADVVFCGYAEPGVASMETLVTWFYTAIGEVGKIGKLGRGVRTWAVWARERGGGDWEGTGRAKEGDNTRL